MHDSIVTQHFRSRIDSSLNLNTQNDISRQSEIQYGDSLDVRPNDYELPEYLD